MKRKKKTKGTYIAGIGSWLPSNVLTNLDLERMVDTTDEWIRTRTGIQERRIAPPELTTSDLASKAALLAIADAGLTPEDIDLIVLATITSDMPTPACACLVQHKIGAKNVACFDISAACCGLLYGFEIGRHFISSGVYRHILIIAADTISRFIDWNDRNTCVLFGDGASAVVLKPTDSDGGILGTYLGTDGSMAHLIEIIAGGSRMPPTVKTITEGLHYLKMKGNEVFKIAVKQMTHSVTQVLSHCNLTVDDIKFLIPHQANKRIIDAVAKILNFPQEKVFINLDKYGNASAASVGIALDELIKSGRVNDGDILVLVSFGAGLTWGATAIRWRLHGQ